MSRPFQSDHKRHTIRLICLIAWYLRSNYRQWMSEKEPLLLTRGGRPLVAIAGSSTSGGPQSETESRWRRPFPCSIRRPRAALPRGATPACRSSSPSIVRGAPNGTARRMMSLRGRLCHSLWHFRGGGLCRARGSVLPRAPGLADRPPPRAATASGTVPAAPELGGQLSRRRRDNVRRPHARRCGSLAATGTPGPEYRSVHAGSLSGSLMAVAPLRT